MLLLLECLLEMLDKCGVDRTSDGDFIINLTAYKKMLYHEYHIAFLAACLPHYPRCKRHYITRPLTYKSWVTLVKQICKSQQFSGIQYK
jgi:hypothetical protein